MQEYKNVVIQGNSSGDMMQQPVSQDNMTILLEKVKTNPDTALSAINNMKIKLEMEVKAVENKISELEQDLSKVNNPTIQEVLKNIKESTEQQQLDASKSVLDELEAKVLSEINKLLKDDKELMATLQNQYGV